LDGRRIDDREIKRRRKRDREREEI